MPGKKHKSIKKFDECKKFNKWGECIEWDTIGGDTPVLSVSAEAKRCAPSLAKEAEENLKKLKVNVSEDKI